MAKLRMMQRDGLRTTATAALAACGLLLSAGCDVDSAPAGVAVTGGLPPTSQPYFPTGVGLHPTEDVLFVVSSNYDLRYGAGGLFAADLEAVEAGLAGVTDPYDPDQGIEGAYVDTVYLSSFGHRPLVLSEGNRILVSTRGDNQINEVEVDVSGESPTLSCGPTEDTVPTCGQLPYAAQIRAGNDPYDIVITRDDDERIEGLVTLLSSPEVVFFAIRLDRTDDARARVSSSTLTLGPNVLGVRAAAMLPGAGSVPDLVLAAVEELEPSATRPSSALLWFDPARGDDAPVRRLDITDEIGAASIRMVRPTADGDAVIVLLRSPDALARLEISADGPTIKASPGGVVPTCESPTGLAMTTLATTSGTVERALVTCFDNDTVAAYDPLTLNQTDAVRYFGRGPVDVAVDESSDPPRAYVSYFLEDSVGVFDLIDDAGDARVVPLGRIGIPRPPPEDGR